MSAEYFLSTPNTIPNPKRRPAAQGTAADFLPPDGAAANPPLEQQADAKPGRSIPAAGLSEQKQAEFAGDFLNAGPQLPGGVTQVKAPTGEHLGFKFDTAGLPELQREFGKTIYSDTPRGATPKGAAADFLKFGQTPATVGATGYPAPKQVADLPLEQRVALNSGGLGAARDFMRRYDAKEIGLDEMAAGVRAGLDANKRERVADYLPKQRTETPYRPSQWKREVDERNARVGAAAEARRLHFSGPEAARHVRKTMEQFSRDRIAGDALAAKTQTEAATLAEETRQANLGAEQDQWERGFKERELDQKGLLDLWKARHPTVTGAQQANNREIQAARRILGDMDRNEIRRRTRQYTDTGRENPDFDPYLEGLVKTATQRMVGEDPGFEGFYSRMFGNETQGQGTAPGESPPYPGARKAADGNWYVQQDGKWFRVEG